MSDDSHHPTIHEEEDGTTATTAAATDKQQDEVHTLSQDWSFWYDIPDNSGDKSARSQVWGATLKKLMDITSVESFWGLVNNISRPSTLPMRSDYHLFQKGVKPEWEDPQNRNGGKWVWEFRGKNDEALMDPAWLHTMLSMIGDQYTEENEVVGCVLSIRKGRNKLALWTRNEAQGPALSTGNEWRKVLNLPSTIKIIYIPHSSALTKSHHSDVQFKFTV